MSDSAKGIVSLVFGIISALCAVFLGGSVGPIIAIVLGIVAMAMGVKSRLRRSVPSGSVGIISGIIGIVLGALSLYLWFTRLR